MAQGYDPHLGKGHYHGGFYSGMCDYNDSRCLSSEQRYDENDSNDCLLRFILCRRSRNSSIECLLSQPRPQKTTIRVIKLSIIKLFIMCLRSAPIRGLFCWVFSAGASPLDRACCPGFDLSLSARCGISVFSPRSSAAIIAFSGASWRTRALPLPLGLWGGPLSMPTAWPVAVVNVPCYSFPERR